MGDPGPYKIGSFAYAVTAVVVAFVGIAVRPLGPDCSGPLLFGAAAFGLSSVCRYIGESYDAKKKSKAKNRKLAALRPTKKE